MGSLKNMFIYFKVISTLILLSLSSIVFSMEELSDKELSGYSAGYGLTVDRLDVEKVINTVFSDVYFGRFVHYTDFSVGAISYEANSSYMTISINGGAERRISLPSHIGYMVFENVSLGEGKPIGDIYFQNIRIY